MQIATLAVRWKQHFKYLEFMVGAKTLWENFVGGDFQRRRKMMKEAAEPKDPTRKSIERQLKREEARKELQRKLRLDYQQRQILLEKLGQDR